MSAPLPPTPFRRPATPAPVLRAVAGAAGLAVTVALASDHWSLQPLEPAPGAGIDDFIRRELAARGLEPSPPADPRTLIRRASYTLTGLPPSPEEVEAFVLDPSPEAYEALVDRLLASPRNGEHWARHWLDVARYSDTKGYVYAREEKRWVHATPYRDWVVSALNEDLPYDRFLLLQIAADQLVPSGSPDLAAMGFLTLGRRFLGVTHDIIDDRIDVVMSGTQGLTVSCARCHDHKFDPIPTADYYALYGVFQSSAEALVPCSPEPPGAELTALLAKHRDLLTKRREEQMERTRTRLADYLQAQDELEKYPEEVFGQILGAADLNPFIVRRFQAWLDRHPDTVWTDELLHAPGSPTHVPDEHIANIEMFFPNNVVTELWKSQGELDRYLLATRDAPPHATILVDRPVPGAPRVFLRGNPLTKGDEVPRRFLSALEKDGPPFRHGSGRLELARAIADPANPLTARVMVNRLWQHHFGRGLVATPSDFGVQGDTPSHPELLDWLAARFIESGWSLKAMHRLMVLSETYRQSSVTDPGPDPENRFLARMTPHRLSFEEARDSWLAVSGQLDDRVGGAPSPLFDGSNRRRTLYALIDRQNLPAVLRTFDFANPDLSIPRRTETSVPQQALFAWNHPFLAGQAKALLRRPDVASLDGPDRVRRLHALLYQRSPDPGELLAALRFVQETPPPATVADEAPQAWRYGFGEWDEATGQVKVFEPLPHFTGSAWQGADEWPNPRLGWAQLTARGGHPGNDRKHAVVRRWIAPASGTYDVRSTLVHEPTVGDGIRAFMSHSRLGQLRGTALLGSSADLGLTAIPCEPGDHLDFIVDIGDGLNSDQFLWAPVITPSVPTTGSGGEALPVAWDAAKDFAGQPRPLLAPWEQLVQVLLLANEFLFVD